MSNFRTSGIDSANRIISLNFAFMLVQTFYGIVSGSLGLLSDSIHMFFDCLALLVGLSAAVMSKWPPSRRFPYGYAKIETFAGFSNVCSEKRTSTRANIYLLAHQCRDHL